MAITRSLNDVGKKVLTLSRREVANEMGIKQKAIKKSFRLKRATFKNLTALVLVQGRAIKLIDFKNTRAVKKGVKSKAYGENKLYEGAFIATMPSGHKGAFRRGKVGNYAKRKRRGGGLAEVIAGANQGKQYAKALPIKELYGPSAPKTMANRRIKTLLEKQIKISFPQILRRNIKFYASRNKR